MLCINNIDIKNKTVLIRVDFNVPITKGKIVDVSRINASIDTIKYVLKQNAGVILISHLGDPVKVDLAFSLQIVVPVLEELLGVTVEFSNNLINRTSIKVAPNQIVLCENIRFIPEEKQNDLEFAKYLASLADVVVIDAFATSHRKHASLYGILRYAKLGAAGFLLYKEVISLQQVLNNPERPLVAVVGGAKISTKITILKSLLNIVDYLIVGGGIANTCLLANGYKIGKSICDLEFLKIAKELDEEFGSKLVLPIDAIVIDNRGNLEQKELSLIDDSDCIFDLGNNTIEKYKNIIQTANTILWNGPLGKYEDSRFINGTKLIAEAIANSRGFSIIGGGDTLAVIEQLNLHKFSYISTGGGAFLEFIENRSLPIIDLLNTFK